MTHRILVVDDEPDITALVAYHLAKAGYRVSTAGNGPDALKAAREERPDIVILDLMLPGVSGLRRAGRAAEAGRDQGRRRHPAHRPPRGDRPDQGPLAGRRRLSDQAVLAPGALAPGGRPAPPARARRRSPPARRWRPARSPSTARPTGRRVDGEELSLTATEYKLLLTLVERRGRVQTRPQLLETVWEAQPDIQTRTVDMHVQRLRTKLGDAGKLIETVRGFGYRFKGNGAGGARAVTFAKRLVAGHAARPPPHRGGPGLGGRALAAARSRGRHRRSARERGAADPRSAAGRLARLGPSGAPAGAAEQPPHHAHRPHGPGPRRQRLSRRARSPPSRTTPAGPRSARRCGAASASRRRRSETVGRDLLYVAVPGGPGRRSASRPT